MAEKKDNVPSKFKDNVFCMLYRDKKNLLEAKARTSSPLSIVLTFSETEPAFKSIALSIELIRNPLSF